VASILGLGKKFTQRGLRRTFQDLARAAQVEGIITRSIGGHATERMQERYSTVHGAEQRAALAKVRPPRDHRHPPAVGRTPRQAVRTRIEPAEVAPSNRLLPAT